MSVSLIDDREELFKAWERVGVYIAKACEHALGTIDGPWVLIRLARGEYRMFIATRDDVPIAAGVVEVVAYPKRWVCNIAAVGGEKGSMDDWAAPMLAACEDWAVEQGCTLITSAGRAGWLRKVRELGFDRQSAMFSKEIAP